ncbi:MAG: hypothetical protein K1060chlam1_01059 [Candidatus Anoxychlamydiales bacterium]|nr:hypothetical protein [Candidatus Anoxychlamydiales bacterium]
MKKIIFYISLGIFTFLISNFFFKADKKLKNIAKADTIGIVTEIKNIKIKNVKNPLNASIEEYFDNYILSFRIDENNSSYIGVSFLDQNFEEIGHFQKIDVQTNSAQDPRIFKFKNDYFLLYNDKLPIEHFARAMHLAKINLKNFIIDYKTILDQHIKTVEKNWVPIIDQKKLLLAYKLMPHKIMQLDDLKKNSLSHLIFENMSFSRFFWKWGTPRGGTPAKKVDDEYLAFFHSSFGKSKKNKTYVMGAYTFEAKAPYRVTKVSKFPIILRNFKNTRVYFPTGFVIKKENNKDMIYLSYGENDKTSKIAVIDKEKLFENMKEVF